MQYGKKADLQVLELPYNPSMSLQGLRIITNVAGPERLMLCELDFSYNAQFGDGAATVLAPLLNAKASKLEVLRLAACGLSRAGVEILAKVVPQSKLRTLDLGRNELQD